MSPIKKIFITLIAGLCLCSSPMTDSPQAMSKQVLGKVLDAHGSVVGGASVMLVRDTLNPMNFSKTTAIDTATSDENGNYGFPAISKGWYNVLAVNAENKGFLDSVYINSGSKTQIRDVILKKPVTCSGKVTLQYREKDNQSAIVLVLGTNVYASPHDSLGNFVLPSIAAGTYKLRILTTIPQYEVKDTTIVIQADIANSLADPIILKSIAPPTLVGPLSINYDGRMKFVTVSWPRLDTNNARLYNIYRKSSIDSKFQLYATQPDTFITEDVLDKVGETLIYSVSAVDHSSNESGLAAPCTLAVTDSLVCQRSVRIADIDSSSWIYFWGAAWDSYGNIYTGTGNTITKYNADGQFITRYTDSTADRAGFFWNWFSIGPDGSVYTMLYFSMRIMRLSSDLSFAQSIPPDTVLSGNLVSLLIDDSGNLYWNGNGKIVKYSPSLFLLNKWQQTYFSGPIQQGNRNLYLLRDPNNSSSIGFFDSTFMQTGSWDFSADVEHYSPDSLLLNQATFYVGKNGWLALFPCTCHKSINNSDRPEITLLFDENQKIRARFLKTGRMVDIDNNGIIHWVSGNVFSTYELR